MSKHSNFKRFVISGLISLFVFVGCEREIRNKQALDWQAYVNIADSIIHSTSGKEVKYFVKLENETYKQVFDFTKWNETFVSFNKVITNSELKIFVEEPFSESGDWNNEYIYVFSQSGKLKLFIRKSSFFNSNCSDGAVTEKEIFEVEKGTLVKKDYTIVDENRIAIEDTSKCIFNYRFKYPVYSDYYKIPIVEKYKNIFNK